MKLVIEINSAERNVEVRANLDKGQDVIATFEYLTDFEKFIKSILKLDALQDADVLLIVNDGQPLLVPLLSIDLSLQAGFIK